MHDARALTGRRGECSEATSSGLVWMVLCRADERDRRFRGGLLRLCVKTKRMMLGAEDARLD